MKDRHRRYDRIDAARRELHTKTDTVKETPNAADVVEHAERVLRALVAADDAGFFDHVDESKRDAASDLKLNTRRARMLIGAEDKR